jgi:hypothetical protein
MRANRKPSPASLRLRRNEHPADALARAPDVAAARARRPRMSRAEHVDAPLARHGGLSTCTTRSPTQPPLRVVLESWRTGDVLPGRAGQARCGFIVTLLSSSSWLALTRLRRLRPAPRRVIGCPALAAGGHRCGYRLRFPRAASRSAHSLAAAAKPVARRSPGRSVQPVARGARLDWRSHLAVKGALRSTLCPGPRSPGGRS